MRFSLAKDFCATRMIPLSRSRVTNQVSWTIVLNSNLLVFRLYQTETESDKPSLRLQFRHYIFCFKNFVVKKSSFFLLWAKNPYFGM